jgi:hypothetical protein
LIWLAHIKTNRTVRGIIMISVKAMSLRMFKDWNSTSEMSRRAPHHEFWPMVWKKNDRIVRDEERGELRLGE